MMTFNVVTWNLRGSARPDLTLAAEAINTFRPDVVLLQEVWREQALRLANLVDMRPPFWSVKHRPFGPFARRRAEGMAVLSRESLTATTSVVLTPAARTWTHRRRIVQHARIPSLGVDVLNAHLASRGEASARVEQAKVICAQITSMAYPNVLVGGDFNADDEPALWAAFATCGLRDADSEAARATNPAGDVARRLDRILVGHSLRIVSVSVPEDGPAWARLSDHLPVAVQIEIDHAGTDA